MKPLQGLVVLDLTRYLAGPYCTLLLGGLGAEVIKVEAPGQGDVYRSRPPYGGPKGASFTKQTDDDLNLGVLHRSRSKKCVSLNLRSAEGKELFLQLCEKADVLVENYAPGTLEKMGFPYAVLKKRNPRLVLCSISGFGQRGPRREWRAYDPIIQAASGISSVTGYADRAPIRCGAAISDTTTPLFAVIGILSALRKRDVTGEGDWVDIAMQDGSFFLLPDVMEFLAAGETPQRMANAYTGGAPFNVYHAKDGYVSVCAPAQADWAKVLVALKREDLANHPHFATIQNRRDHRQEVDQLIQEWIGQYTVQEAVTYLQEQGVPAGPILNPEELLTDEHLNARDMIVPLEHPLHGPIPGAKAIGMPIKLTSTPLAFDQPAPALGGHNEDIYGRLLGLDGPRLQELKERGVI